MHSTSARGPGAGETLGVAAGACLSAIALAAVLEMTLAPHPPRMAFSTGDEPAIRRFDATLTLERLARVTRLPPPVPEERLAEGVRAGSVCDLSMQARIVPLFRDGQAVGFRLSGFRPDSPYARFGFHDGDVIRRINGIDMDSPEKALEAYSQVKDATRFEVDIERDCQLMRKTYLLQ